MHSTLTILAFVSAALSIGPFIQSGVEPKAVEPRKGDAVIVTGCITGPTIEETDTLRTYRLTGEKAIVKELAKAHNGHIDEVSGILKSTLIAPATRSKQIGKTRITIGAVESRSTSDHRAPMPELPVLSVKSFRHLAGICAK
jgi:hypothetical protein